jgi:N utilization substance protein B
MRIETRARARALQALYAWDLRGRPPIERVAAQIWDDLALSTEERRLAGRFVRVLARDGDAIDADLTDITANWRLERLGVIDRCVLRLAAAELRQGETPPRVVIQEAVHLAERFAGDRSARFVNGVLDALARRMGRL